ncbi:MAG: hypothetical protein ACTSQY_11175, partial [Candidatus Odinarchaeia archaeon]
LCDLAGSSFSGTLEDKVKEILVTNINTLYLDKRGFPLWLNGGSYYIPTTYEESTNIITDGVVVTDPNFLKDKDNIDIKLGALWLRFTTNTDNPGEDLSKSI